MARRPRPSLQSFKTTSPGELVWDMLTFDRLLTGPVIHLIYWAGLLICVLGGFSVVGGAVGVALREGGWQSIALALPMLVGGLLVVFALALLWRAFCEFYVALFRISDDLAAIRAAAEEGRPTILTPPGVRAAPGESDDLFDARPEAARRGGALS